MSTEWLRYQLIRRFRWYFYNIFSCYSVYLERPRDVSRDVDLTIPSVSIFLIKTGTGDRVVSGSHGSGRCKNARIFKKKVNFLLTNWFNLIIIIHVLESIYKQEYIYIHYCKVILKCKFTMGFSNIVYNVLFR